MAKMTVNSALQEAVAALKLGDPNNIKRVVIDLDVRREPHIYVECYGDPEGTIQVIKAMTTLDVGMVIASTANTTAPEANIITEGNK